LTSVDFPASVLDIGTKAFSNCIALTRVVVPDGVSFGDKVFKNCRQLTQIDSRSVAEKREDISCTINALKEAKRDCDFEPELRIKEGEIVRIPRKQCEQSKQYKQEGSTRLNRLKRLKRLKVLAKQLEVSTICSLKNIGKAVFQGCTALQKLAFGPETGVTVKDIGRVLGKNDMQVCVDDTWYSYDGAAAWVATEDLGTRIMD
jgi:hypothetical protein